MAKSWTYWCKSCVHQNQGWSSIECSECLQKNIPWNHKSPLQKPDSDGQPFAGPQSKPVSDPIIIDTD